MHAGQGIDKEGTRVVLVRLQGGCTAFFEKQATPYPAMVERVHRFFYAPESDVKFVGSGV